ncbi:MAG: LAGLIDADG family homing endonuclease [Candidatus Woesearchaeota archaeon]
MLDDNYVLGLVDGEGSFNVMISHNKRRAKVELKFCLKLRHQDKEVLDELQTFFGCGKVYIQRDKRANHSLCYRFEVQNKKEIVQKIIPFFEKHQPKLPSRKRDFELFRQITEISTREPVDLGKIEELKGKLHWGLAVYRKTVRAVGTPSNPMGEKGNARQTTRAGFR